MITNKSFYCLKSYKEFQKMLYRKVKVLSCITSFILVVIGVFLMFFEMPGYMYIVFGIALPIFINVFIRAMENENIKKSALLRCGAYQTFNFNEESVDIHQESKLGIFNDTYFYNEFISVYKSKEYYFFFVTRAQAFIVEVNGFISGSDKELDKLLTTVMGKRFVNKGHK